MDKKNYKNTYQKGNTENEGILVLFGLGLLGLFVAWVFGFNFGNQEEGIVKYADCRQTVTLKEGDWSTYFNKFTCDESKTTTGKSMGGQCVSVKLNNNSCEKAYVYQKSPEIKCPDTVNGYLSVSGECKCNSGYKFDNTSNKCEFDNSKVTIYCHYGNKKIINGTDSNIKFSYSNFNYDGSFNYDFDINDKLQKVCEIGDNDLSLLNENGGTLFSVYLAK